MLENNSVCYIFEFLTGKIIDKINIHEDIIAKL